MRTSHKGNPTIGGGMSGSSALEEAALWVIDDWDGTHVITSPDVMDTSYLAVRIARPGAVGTHDQSRVTV